LKDHYQNAGHEIDQIGAYRCVQWHGSVFSCDQQVQKLQLHLDNLPRIRQLPFAKAYREHGLRRSVGN
jgi:hypothetical protein